MSPSVFSLNSLLIKSDNIRKPFEKLMIPAAVSSFVRERKCLRASAKSIPPPSLMMVDELPPPPTDTVEPVG